MIVAELDTSGEALAATVTGSVAGGVFASRVRKVGVAGWAERSPGIPQSAAQRMSKNTRDCFIVARYYRGIFSL